MERRYLHLHDIQTRSDDDSEKIVEGYFAVFNEIYQVWPDVTESIAPGAFSEALGGDIRALYNHNDDQILGRTSAGTLELREDEKGLWGKIKINEKDTEAVNVYERIARGDITGCSFGFNIESEEYQVREDGTVHWTITKVNPLYEVSPCVFPAYEQTSIESRGRDLKTIRAREIESKKARLLAKIRKEKKEDGTESPAPEEED